MKKETQEPVITTEKISKTQLATIFHSARATKITIKHVEYETKVDTELLIKNFKEHANRTLEMKIADLNKQYESKIKSLNLKNIGYLLKQIYSVIGSNGWNLSLDAGSLVAKKIFNPIFPITQAHKAGNIITYETPCCHLKEIKVFLDCEKIYRLDVTCDGRHPNVNGVNAACTGDLSKIKIELDKPNFLATILSRIENTYKLPNLDSPHHVPDTPILKTERRTGVWG